MNGAGVNWQIVWTYRINLPFLDFGEYTKTNIEIYEVVKEEVTLLAEKTGEVAQFLVEEHGWEIYICNRYGKSGVQTASYMGDRKHSHCTDVGKGILASLLRKGVEEIINIRSMPTKTEKTITDCKELYKELGEIRLSGVTFDNEEILQGFQCIAVPITN